MNIAVLADIHSNHIALEACLEEAEARHADTYLFLGDYLDELAYPAITLHLLDQIAAQHPCVLIRGNKEDYWIDQYRGTDPVKWQAGTSGTGMLAYVYEQLSPERIVSFDQMPIAKTIRYPGLPSFVICHGSPWRANESLREDFDYIDERTRHLETELTICGHFHIQCDYVRHGKRVVNPGAVGVPLRSHGLTQFMMLSDVGGRWKTDFISLPYDRERAIQEMDDEKLDQQAPGWYRVTKEVIRTGKPAHLTALTKAHDLYEKDTGTSSWNAIPEKYWEMALEEMHIPM